MFSTHNTIITITENVTRGGRSVLLEHMSQCTQLSLLNVDLILNIC